MDKKKKKLYVCVSADSIFNKVCFESHTSYFVFQKLVCSCESVVLNKVWLSSGFVRKVTVFVFSLSLCSVSLYILNTPISRVFEYVWFFSSPALRFYLFGNILYCRYSDNWNWYFRRILTSFCTIKKWICFLGLEFSSMMCSSCLERVLCAHWIVKCMYIT